MERDASKAFDRINHGKLFRLLLQRGMPPLIVRVLINCYVNQSISVSWNNHRSESFDCLNGVKQGGVLSPILFTVYIDELLLKLRSSGFGCYIDDTFVGALGCADVTEYSWLKTNGRYLWDICCGIRYKFQREKDSSHIVWQWWIVRVSFKT